jgi:hypothetical protein
MGTLGKRPLWRSRRRWQNNIKRDVKEMGCEDVSFSEVSQGPM